MSTRRHSHGYTLIELLVALSIAAILVVLAAPTYVVWLADSQIQGGAELIADGLRYARAEAIKRNEQVQLVVDPTAVTGGWAAQLVSDGSTLRTTVFLEGADKVLFAMTPAGNRTITYTGLGQVAPANADATAPFQRVDVTSTLAGTRPLRVVAIMPGELGGRIKLCDPSFPATDPKACP